MSRTVPLPRAYRLLNHGPIVLVSAAHGGRRNVMAAAWAMPLDFAPPPKLAALRTLHHIAGGSFFSVADPLQATLLR